MSESPKIKKLTRSDWPRWIEDFQAYAGTKGLWGVCIGREVAPTPADPNALTRDERIDMLAYETRLDKASGEIWLTVSDELREDIRDVQGDPKAMLDTLEAKYNKKAPGSRFKAYNAFLNTSIRLDIPSLEILPALPTDISAAMSTVRRLRPDNYGLDEMEAELATMVALRALQVSDNPDHRLLASSFMMNPNLSWTDIESAVDRDFQSKSEPGVKQEEDTVLAMAAGLGPCFLCDGPHYVKDCPDLSKAKRNLASSPSMNRRGRGRGRGTANSATSSPKPESSLPTANLAATAEFAGKASAFASADNRSQWFRSEASANWNTDTGASSHMTPHRSWFISYSKHRVPVRLADNSVIYSEGIGSVEFQPDGGGTSVIFHDTLHVPDIACNL
ncbi:hypothetical protein F5879DRAFT_812464, partial [Lentinula edodes]